MINTAKSIENKYKNPLLIRDLSIKPTCVFNIILDMKTRYDFLAPSQQWIGNAAGCARETANIAIKQLVELNFIKKRKRGFKFIDQKTDTYLEETCEYTIDKRFIQKLKEIHKTEDKNSPFMLDLIRRLPALRKYFLAFLTVFILSLNNVYLNSTLKSIRSSSQTFFGKDNYEIHKIYETEEISHTITLPVGDLVMNDHPANEYQTEYQYTEQNSKLINTKGNHKGGSIDLRNCTETLFSILNSNEKKIAIFYFNGKRTHGSIEKFERALQQKNMWNKIWRPIYNTSWLSKEQRSIISSFPYSTVLFIRDMLEQYPERCNDFNWIYDKCINKCKMDNTEIVQLLKKHGYSYKEFKHKKTYASRSAIPTNLLQYKMFKPRQPLITKEQQDVDKKKINPKFKFLVGEKIFDTLFKSD